MKQVLVTGGTGTLGREVIHQLIEQGNEVSVLTSKEKTDLPPSVKIYHCDLTKPDTLQKAGLNAEVIVHCASNSSDSQNVDVLGTRNLLATVSRDKLKHFIYISIVGVDKSDFPYYKAKYEVERQVENSGLPYTILRATQFHDFVLNRLIHPFDKGLGKVLELPKGLRLQPIDIIEVSEVVTELTNNNARNTTIEIGGPEVLSIGKLAQGYFDYIGRKDKIELVPMDIFKVFQTGINLCPDKKRGQITWEKYLKFNLSGEISN